MNHNISICADMWEEIISNKRKSIAVSPKHNIVIGDILTFYLKGISDCRSRNCYINVGVYELVNVSFYAPVDQLIVVVFEVVSIRHYDGFLATF